jgi:YbbR domain-containing protein
MSRLSMNIDTISVNQNILFTKTVPITCIPSGKPVDGYKANGKVELSPSMITIAGPRPVLDNITQIAIPSSAVNINDEDSTYKTIVNINGYLPSGVTASDRNFGGNVSVSVQIEKEISKKYSVYLNKISMEGLDSNMTAEVTDNTLSASGNKVEIEVFGLPDELDGLSSSDFDLSVDFDKYKDEKKITAMKAGTYDLPLQIDMPSGLRTESNLRVRVKVSEK